MTNNIESSMCSAHWQGAVSRPHATKGQRVHNSWRLQQSLRGMGLQRSRQKRRGSRGLTGWQWSCYSERSWWSSNLVFKTMAQQYCTPDLVFATNDVSRIASRTALSQLGGSDHKPIKISLDLQYRAQRISTFPRWNYKKANWECLSQLVNQLTQKISNKRQNLNTEIKALSQAVLKADQEVNPRGPRRNYKPYWTEEL